MSRDEGALLTVQTPRAGWSLPVGPSVKPVGEPDAVAPHVRFDERDGKRGVGHWPYATAPILDSTFAEVALGSRNVC